MITTVLLFIIYIAFISLGLPDSILGVSIPAIREEFGISLSVSGVVSMIVIGSTIFSSFISGFVIKKLGTGKIVFFSCILTGVALLGISLSQEFWLITILAIPLGLGGGSVDAALNNYVAMNYKARHMNWLHSFWGVGATLGPIIMAVSLSSFGWRGGYRSISLIQLILSLFLFFSLPLWKRVNKNSPISKDKEPAMNDLSNGVVLFKNKGIIFTLATAMFYCSGEALVGLWGSSFLVNAGGLNIEKAASIMAFYFGGITAGRFLSGFLSIRLNNRQMIRAGMIISLIGILILFIKLNEITAAIAVVVIGLGFAPIYPALLHETPARFGQSIAQRLIGYQIGFAGIGGAVISPLTGVLLQYTSISLLPVFIAVIVITAFISSELINRTC